MQAVILAAGMGKRLKNLTADNTKCMVRVNGITIIERMLMILDKKELSEIIIVVGYCGDRLKKYIDTLTIRTPIRFIENALYDKTNNIYSLALAGKYLCQEDTILLESDLLFEESVIDELLSDPRDSLVLVDKFESWMDGTCTVLDSDDRIVDFIPGKYLDFKNKNNYHKTVNIYKFSSHFSQNTYLPFLEAYSKAMGNNEYYESVIKLIVMLDTKEIRAKRLGGQLWYEIDDIQDLDIAETLFADTPEKRYDLLMKRYGGYWRYPHLKDYCYLVNPYFPPEKLVEEIRASAYTLLSQYPSGMDVNSLLAAKNFGVQRDYIMVGNGAAELIKELLNEEDFAKVGIIRPTFEEYPGRLCHTVILDTAAERNLQYGAEDVIAFFDKKDIDTLILINPDNPSGNMIKRSDLTKLLSWAKKKGIALILDESFSDFADIEEGQEDLSLIHDDILESYKKLYVIKSISKSYGVPGLRLGVLASSDTARIASLKKRTSIWNINSFGEFFMQIYEKYQEEYYVSLLKLRAARKQMTMRLKEIENLCVYESQANYIMCEIIKTSITSKELAVRLFEENFFIKDLTPKIGNGKQYIRLAIRTMEENEELVKVLNRMLT